MGMGICNESMDMRSITKFENKNDCTVDQLPCPKTISKEESRIVQNCLLRWQTEATSDMSYLEESIKGINQQLESMYDEEELKCLEYQLHAVMVHEGSIDSGHYWTYVHDRNRQTWLKFNDNTVSEVLWDELLKESIGGHSKTSAYSLVYIDASKSDILLKTEPDGTNTKNMELNEMEVLARSLPLDLAEMVQKSNNEFIEECVKWDVAQEEKRALEEAKQKEAMEQERKRLKQYKEEQKLQKEFKGINDSDSSDANNNKVDKENNDSDSRVLRNSKEFKRLEKSYIN